MGGGERTFKTVVLEDGMFAVVRTDPAKPQVMEVVGMFYTEASARRYADFENAQLSGASGEPPAPRPGNFAKAAEESVIEQNGAGPELTERQSAVLEALRARAGGDDCVEIKGADLAEAASIPLGSVHSIIQSLEKKKRIAITRPGTAHAPPIYQVF